MRKPFAVVALALAAHAAAQDAPEPPTPASVVAAAPVADWRAIDPADLLVITLAPDRDGHPRQVIIQLLPPPFSQGWVGNIRTLARAHWWDGTSVYRVVDNWVAQWGDGEDDEARAKPLPAGIVKVPESEYIGPPPADLAADADWQMAVNWARGIRESSEPLVIATSFQGRPDSYAPAIRYWAGWPFGTDFETVWPIHCYAHVGVARSTDSTGTGAELYAVIGHAPRQLDRNIAVVGRVIEGIEHLSTLPRGKGANGVYDDAALRVPIVSVRLGDELPAAERPRFEYLASDSASFAKYVRVRANRRDAFYKVPAGGIDVCNVQVPIRRVPGA